MNTILNISAAGMVCGESPQLDSRSSARGTSSSHGPLETPVVVFLQGRCTTGNDGTTGGHYMRGDGDMAKGGGSSVKRDEPMEGRGTTGGGGTTGDACTPGHLSAGAMSRDLAYIVLYRGRYPVRIIGQVTGRVFALVGRVEATRFVSEGEARQRALTAGVTLENIFVQAVSARPDDLNAPVRRAGGED